ncbi:MAG: FtsX-like permease family protein [Alistipes onderdonkii]
MGVVKDFRTVVATGQVEPIVFHPFSYFQKFGATDDYMLDYSMMIRLRGMSPESLDAVQRKIERIPFGQQSYARSLRQYTGPHTLFEIRSFRNIVFTVSGITLLIALMGLVGYLGDEMRRRSKEIALRKVNGASTADVLRLLARDVLWIAVPSVVVGAAVSRWGADLLVSNFVERVALRWWLFALCGAVVLLIVCAVQLVRTWRIANANPIDMIKTE